MGAFATPLYLDHLKSARPRRERYEGPRPPEPLTTHMPVVTLDRVGQPMAIEGLVELAANCAGRHVVDEPHVEDVSTERIAHGERVATPKVLRASRAFEIDRPKIDPCGVK